MPSRHAFIGCVCASRRRAASSPASPSHATRQTAHAEGYKPWSAKVDIPAAPGETAVDIPELEADPQANPGGPSSSAGGMTSSPPSTPDTAPAGGEDKRGDGQRVLGVVVAGVGVLGLAAGSIFGLMSISKNSEADENCNPRDPTKCSDVGKAAGDDAILFGNISTIAFIAGGALLVGGAIVYFSAPAHVKSVALAKRTSKPIIAPQIGPHGSGVSLLMPF
jgi:hypothetical protein